MEVERESAAAEQVRLRELQDAAAWEKRVATVEQTRLKEEQQETVTALVIQTYIVVWTCREFSHSS